MPFRIIFLLFFLLKALPSFAEGRVVDFLSPREFLAELTSDSSFQDGMRVIVISEKEKKMVGLGEVVDLMVRDDKFFAKIKIQEIVGNYLIMVDDKIEPLDFIIFEKRKIPGFNSLTLTGSHKIPSQYKELAYFGVFTSEGHTIDQNEFLFSPFQAQYGVTNEFNVRVVNALWLDGYLNLGGKYKVVQNKYAKITANALVAYKVQKQDWIGQVGGVITTPSNAKFQNHLMFTFTVDPEFEDSKATRGLNLFSDSDIRSITEYITDNWNRILYGPVYNVELQTFGGTVSYMWIWTTFHMSLGVATRDLSNLTFGENGYYYIYDLFWRF
jgi:hypothetical protein